MSSGYSTVDIFQFRLPLTRFPMLNVKHHDAQIRQARTVDEYYSILLINHDNTTSKSAAYITRPR